MTRFSRFFLMPRRFLSVLAVCLFLGLPALFAEDARVGRDTCLGCHEGIMSKSIHGQLSPKYPGLATLDCENCHTKMEPHASSSGASASVRVSPATMKTNCLVCHPQDKTLSAAWKSGAHYGLAEKDCTMCHTFHKNDQPAQLKTSQIELCQSCHEDVKAEFSRPYKHPLADGQVECSSCHDPHEVQHAAGKLLTKPTKCLDCHSEIRGPFMFAHKAITDQDSCMNCHNPHGGTARKLLKTTDNQLCLNCHQAELLLSSYLPNTGDQRSQARMEHSRIPQLQSQCKNCHIPLTNPVVGVHTSKVPMSECTLCHASIRGIDHTRYITSGRCIDCHTDIHGSNHNRAFLDMEPNP
ncbi:MAG: hypothetical protein HQM09_16960 [Candidatus Riflebacteria bacterium]|nr:hypothetical protein [Candidatus Riflebacteria bacterium]